MNLLNKCLPWLFACLLTLQIFRLSLRFLPSEFNSESKLEEPANFKYVVSSVTTSSNLGNIFFPKNPAEGATYVCIEWEYKNVSGKPLSGFRHPVLYLVDPGGVKYSCDLSATVTFQQGLDLNQKILSDINPNITIRDAKVFEVSSDLLQRKGWRILIKEKRETEIPLSF